MFNHEQCIILITGPSYRNNNMSVRIDSFEIALEAGFTGLHTRTGDLMLDNNSNICQQ